jgi:biopolymer transport protein ExbD
LPGQVVQGADRLYVSVDGLGQAYLDQQPVTLDLLYDVLLQFNQVNPNGLMVLYASRDARYEDVVAVLDLLRSVGGNRVALATLPTDANLAPGDQTTPQGFPEVLPEGSPGGLPEGFPEDFPSGSDPQPGVDPFAPTAPFPSQPTAPLEPAPAKPLGN